MVLVSAACSGSLTSTDTPEPAAESILRPPSDLTAGCYDFPSPDPTYTDHVILAVSVTGGDAGVDFCLKDTAGEEHCVSDLLASHPVVLLFGAFS
jgi:hypothetical protein